MPGIILFVCIAGIIWWKPRLPTWYDSVHETLIKAVSDNNVGWYVLEAAYCVVQFEGHFISFVVALCIWALPASRRAHVSKETGKKRSTSVL